MQLLYCDESNLEDRPGDFLIYAGVMIPTDRAKQLSDAIGTLRRTAGIDPSSLVKFAPAAAPLDHAGYRAFKQAIIEAAIEHGCKLLAYAVLHDLSQGPDVARRWGINTICWHFQCALRRLEQPGLVLIDRFNDAGNLIDDHLREKMSIGVDLPHRNGTTPLDRVIGFHYAAIGQAHFTSLSDILIGSLRWAINVHCRGQDLRDNALALLEILSPMFWRDQESESIPDIGFCFSPFKIKSARFHAQYISLQEFLRDGNIQSSQIIELIG
ncbi:DUF3800 domain-containing protein [Sphingopyxis sp. PAMC25046]|uniref:DUF3800 domain-containing protein n=1 Tax=Sphingopyxis sp. PAMC25046 TaxID=2565556 RepID=UPI0014457DAD|nr:DUF3800 domain-containing protein [Sphingopyxis sp. PAMC25046]